MSLWNKNPEKYNELIRIGIVHYLDIRLDKSGWATDELLGPGIWGLVELIQTDPPLKGVYQELQRLATLDILKVEQDYFGGLTDQTKDFHL